MYLFYNIASIKHTFLQEHVYLKVSILGKAINVKIIGKIFKNCSVFPIEKRKGTVLRTLILK